MRVLLQSVVPGMEQAEETDLRTEVAWIAGDLQQSCSTSVTNLQAQILQDGLIS